MRRCLLSASVMLFLCGVLSADTVVFVNGDRLTGTVVRLEDGSLIIKSEVIGEVKIDIAKVSSFSMDYPGEFHLEDGTVVRSTARESGSGSVTLAGAEILPGGTVSLSKIRSINPVVIPPVVFKGSIGIGFNSTHGNTYIENGNVAVELNRRSKKHRTSLAGLYLVSRDKDDSTGDKRTTEENLTLDSKHDFFVTDKFYNYFSGSFKKDHIADLDYRIIAGVGLGYQWLESSKISFASDAGLAELCEQYTTNSQTTREDELSAELGYALDWKMTKKWNFIHRLRYYPSFATVSDYYLRTSGELRVDLVGSLFTSLKAVLDYDTSPGEGVGKTDTKYIFNVGLKF